MKKFPQDLLLSLVAYNVIEVKALHGEATKSLVFFCAINVTHPSSKGNPVHEISGALNPQSAAQVKVCGHSRTVLLVMT